jgi:hypothetical protein
MHVQFSFNFLEVLFCFFYLLLPFILIVLFLNCVRYFFFYCFSCLFFCFFKKFLQFLLLNLKLFVGIGCLIFYLFQYIGFIWCSVAFQFFYFNWDFCHYFRFDFFSWLLNLFVKIFVKLAFIFRGIAFLFLHAFLNVVLLLLVILLNLRKYFFFDQF